MMMRLLALIFSIFLYSITSAQSLEMVSKFDSRLMKYYKVDTCKMYETIKGKHETIKYLTKVFIFNPAGNVSKEIEFDIVDHHIIQSITYSYNADQNLIRKTISRPERDPIVYDYLYRGEKWIGIKTTYPYYKEYEIQATETGLVLGILGKAKIQELDPETYEPTGKEVFGTMEEYEYRYNRHYKIVKETYYYMNKGISMTTYQFPPNGYGAPLSKKYYKAFGEQELDSLKAPLTITTYSYDGTGFLSEEVTKDNEAGTQNTLSYEYAYAYDSPLKQRQPEKKRGEKFWIGKENKNKAAPTK